MKPDATLTTLTLLTISLAALAVSGTAKAGTQPFTTNYNLAARAKIAVTPATINFPDADPQYYPIIQATENPVVVTVKIRKDPSVSLLATLVCQGGPLVSGSDQIPSANITWTASGTGFVGGTLSSTAPQTVGTWPLSGVYTGNLYFSLSNLWTYATGTYSGNIIYTLTAP